MAKSQQTYAQKCQDLIHRDLISWHPMFSRRKEHIELRNFLGSLVLTYLNDDPRSRIKDLPADPKTLVFDVLYELLEFQYSSCALDPSLRSLHAIFSDNMREYQQLCKALDVTDWRKTTKEYVVYQHEYVPSAHVCSANKNAI